jgi:molybdopterin-guanine dinucleotide biosynthesis protein A
MSGSLRLGAVILTGGTAARMGGVDKASLQLGGVTLLEHALAATTAASEVVVVGGEVPTRRRVTWTREHPPLGGPAAGILAGLDGFRTAPDLLCVLAVDMPGVTVDAVARLTAAVTSDPSSDGAVLVDDDGRRQVLAAVYRASALQAARPERPEDEAGLPVRRLVGSLRLVEVPAIGQEPCDVDTWRDLRRLNQ